MSPIVGLTDQRTSFPKIGDLRKGAAKQSNGQAGRDLKFFRFTSTEPGLEQEFERLHGKEPSSIIVYLPFATWDENFTAWRENWGNSNGLKCRCDGEYMVRWLDEKTNKYRNSPPEPSRPCPYNDSLRPKCKPTGRLSVIDPELKRFAYILVHTTATYDVMALCEHLRAAQFNIAVLTNREDMRGVPFILRRGPRAVWVSTDDGKRMRTEKSLLSIEIDPRWVSRQLDAMSRALSAPLEQALLPQASGEVSVNVADLEDDEIEDPILADPVTGEVIDPPKAATVNRKSTPVPKPVSNGKPANPWPAIPDEFAHKGKLYEFFKDTMNLTQDAVHAALNIKNPLGLGDLQEDAKKVRAYYGTNPDAAAVDPVPSSVDVPPDVPETAAGEEPIPW